MPNKPRRTHVDAAAQDTTSAPILIADDDEATRSQLRRALERAGYTVIEADDGEVALALCESRRPALVLMGGIMPKLDGFAACHALQGTRWGSMIPVLILTVLEDEPSIERAFDAGAYDYLTKPINLSVLTHRIRHILISSLAEQQLLRFAYEDELTGLANRRLFLDRLNQALGRRRRPESQFALLFVDMDKLKSVNDSLGHEAGDTVLKAFAGRLSATVRESDTIARLAGDEFALLIDDIESPQAVAQVASKLLHAVREPVQVGEDEVHVTASIGIALSTVDGDGDADLLLRRADVAMYRCKQKGRDNFLFYSDDAASSTMGQMLHGQELLRAIEADQFTIHYQPIFRLDDATLAGAEALIRWHPPDTELVYPAKFMGLIEETDLIIPLGNWLLQRVCQQFARWQALNYHVGTLTINVSTRQLADPALVDRLRDILNNNAVEPRYLELDITEQSLMRHSGAIAKTLDGLHELGVTVALEDFGSRGWTSLAHLENFPVDTIKMDRSIVHAMLHQKVSLAAIQSACIVSRSYNRNVVAKGVETLEQLTELQSLRCHRGQGYYWSESLSASAYERRFFMEESLQ